MRLPSFTDRNRNPSPFMAGGLLDELFSDLEDNFFSKGLTALGNTDIYEKDGSLHYELELPGLSKDNIQIQARGDELIVSGELNQEEETEDTNYLCRGRRYGKFRRSLPLPEEVEEVGKLSAKFENGVLHIQAPLSRTLGKQGAVDVEIQ